jgi:hypothetical protein
MSFKIGEFVIVGKPKRSTHPSPQAKDVHPAQHGETYSYIIEKFWKVVRVFDDGTIEIETRGGKRHRLDTDNTLLRKAGFWDRLMFRHRFF